MSSHHPIAMPRVERIPMLLKAALAAAPDIALSGGYLSTPWWLDDVHDIGQVILIGIGIVVGLLRIEAMWRARRSSSTSNPGDQS
ncbi:hypothetical protein [Azospirillum palustre]|nr:hypothetical protein [Azospirillum palustre]